VQTYIKKIIHYAFANKNDEFFLKRSPVRMKFTPVPRGQIKISAAVYIFEPTVLQPVIFFSWRSPRLSRSNAGAGAYEKKLRLHEIFFGIWSLEISIINLK
jgi:hypothetical protein